MLKGKRRKTLSSFGPDGRRIGSSGLGTGPSFSRKRPLGSNTSIIPRSLPATGIHNGSSGSTRTGAEAHTNTTTNNNNNNHGAVASDPSSRPLVPSATFGKRRVATIQRAPILCGLNVVVGSAGLLKPFQRPKLGRRAYKGKEDELLKKSSLGARRSTGGMQRLLSRAGKGLHYLGKRPRRPGESSTDDSSGDEDDGNEKEEDRPFEPLMVWNSPFQGGEAKGLPSSMVTEVQTDEYGVEETVTVLKPAPKQRYSSQNVFVPPILAKWLRPHQREGVNFMYQCVMGMKDYGGSGCILADDMGLGKTLQSVTLIYTLLKTGITADKKPTAKRVIVVCPCSLVKNWDNEFVKWLGPGAVKTLALAEADRKKIEKDLETFAKTSIFQILICSYECLRTHVGRLTKYKDCCDLLVCDEAHRLKNSENQTSRALNSLPVKRRVLLTGTPMQNDLSEFFAMTDFTNSGVLGTPEEFRKNILFPLLRGREPDATPRQKQRMMEIQNEMSTTVNEFILRRINTVNAEHLPPKLVQVVCCNLTEIQKNMYSHLVTSKDMQHVMDGKQVNCLGSIQMLMKLCNHPSLIAEYDETHGQKQQQNGRRRAAAKQVKYTDGEESSTAAPGADGISKFLPFSTGGGGRGNQGPVHPEWSGKMFVLYRLMREMRKPGNGGDKIVIISNYTQTLDLIGRMCRENSWGFCRLDGSVTMKKRQKMVDEFNDPSSPLVAFLLSSKAGGCGLNLIGGNRLVLFDPDWNPAVDKQAAARCWRDGQKKRCFTYRFLATGTVEEKIFQRQLSKEGLQSVVDDKEQVNALATKDLRNLFKLRSETPSDTHDKLKCERCKIIHDDAEMKERKVLPKKLAACLELVNKMAEHEDARFFLNPLNPEDHNVTKEHYEKKVKQPIDLGSIQKRLLVPPDQNGKGIQAYKSVSNVSKDVNRIFANVMKVWSPGDDPIADSAGRLHLWWVEQWQELVPVLMTMKPDVEKSEDAVDEEVSTDSMEGCDNLRNERGDDYQEQIGMPDEENMRSWSHHHTTDTVDDPIFRAAMRGFDSVSFVFGLEVTWGKIQQRQQEEEDRAAMKELEAMEELQQIDEDSEDENEETKESKAESPDDANAAAVEVENENEEVEESESSDDANVAAMEVENEEEIGALDDSNESKHATATQDSTSPQSSIENSPERAPGNDGGTPEAQIIETPGSDVPSSSTPVEVLSVGSIENDSPQKHSSPTKKKVWECRRCTMENKLSKRKCEACGSNRPRNIS